MRTLEARRHSLRKAGGGSQLSQAGVDLARAIGGQIGPFDYVATSTVPRARETALAMGFAVDQELMPLLGEEEVIADLEASGWSKDPQPLAALGRLVRAGGPAGRYGSAVATLWRDLLMPLGEDAKVLVITHSGDLELALVSCLMDADHAAWGGPFEPMEGARLTFGRDPARFLSLEPIRLPARGG
jgi:broad specificity phosphatase PhoE